MGKRSSAVIAATGFDYAADVADADYGTPELIGLASPTAEDFIAG